MKVTVNGEVVDVGPELIEKAYGVVIVVTKDDKVVPIWAGKLSMGTTLQVLMKDNSPKVVYSVDELMEVLQRHRVNIICENDNAT